MTRVGSATSRGASVINIYRYLFSGVRTQSSCPDSAYSPIGRLRLKAKNSKLSTTQRPSQPILLEEAGTVPPSRPLRLARGRGGWCEDERGRWVRVRQNCRGRARDAVKNLKGRTDTAKERLTGADYYDRAYINMNTTNRNLGTRKVEKVGLPVTEVGNGLLFDQLALAVVQVQFHFAWDLWYEDRRRRANEVYHVQPRARACTEADHPERECRSRRGKHHLR